MLTAEGGDAFGQILVQGDNVIVPAAGNFYVGLCNQTPAFSDTLVSITTEPTSAGGYARQPLSRDATGWPNTNINVNGENLWRSAILTFAASGADFSDPFTRLFLCNVVSGTAGILFAYSGASPSEILILDGTSRDLIFEIFS